MSSNINNKPFSDIKPREKTAHGTIFENILTLFLDLKLWHSTVCTVCKTCQGDRLSLFKRFGFSPFTIKERSKNV